MANLYGENVGTNYVGILNLGNGLNTSISTTLEPITDGDGITSSLSILDTKVAVNSEIYIGNDRSGTWEPGIYNTSDSNVNISINPNTIVVSNDYKTGSYNSAKTPSAIFEMASITQGMLLPRMNNVNVPNIDSPGVGLVIYNLDINGIQYYDGTQWMNVTATPV